LSGGSTRARQLKASAQQDGEILGRAGDKREKARHADDNDQG